MEDIALEATNAAAADVAATVATENDFVFVFVLVEGIVAFRVADEDVENKELDVEPTMLLLGRLLWGDMAKANKLLLLLVCVLGWKV